MALSLRRNRHGRGLRTPLLPPAVPRWRSRSAAFDAAVLDAYAPLEQRFHDELTTLDVAVDVVPRMRLHPDETYFSREIVADGPVPLGRLIPTAVDGRGRPTRSRIVLFRRPIEARFTTVEERSFLICRILTQLVAAYLNLDPTDIDPGFEDF